MGSQMLIRIDAELKEKVTRYANAEGKNVSQVVRELIRDYVKNRDIGAYIDELWSRTGEKLRRKGKTEEDVEEAVRSARLKKS